MNATTCDICGCNRTPAEIEYMPYRMCAECGEMTEELAHLARSGVIHGEGPCEMTTSAPVGIRESGTGTTAGHASPALLVTNAAADGSTSQTRVPPPRPSPMASIHRAIERPAPVGWLWFYVLLILAAWVVA